MSGRTFLDTNVPVYVFDHDEPRKRKIAAEILEHAAGTGGFSLSTQVLQEFYVSVTRKLARGLPEPMALSATRNLATLHVVGIDNEMVFRAIELSQEHFLSFWDALIIQAALEANCEVLLTEDLQHGREILDLRIENPFRDAEAG
jgi:predicted nucleic acid-binding protein